MNGALMAAMVGLSFVGCVRGSTKNGTGKVAATENGPASEHRPLDISVSCSPANGTTYELFLKVDNKGLKHVQDVTMTASYVGVFTASQMQTGKLPVEKIEIRRNEILGVNDCISKHLSEEPLKQVGNANFNKFPSVSRHPDLPGTKLDLMVSNSYLKNSVDRLRSALEVKDWEKSYHLMGELGVVLGLTGKEFFEVFGKSEESKRDYFNLKSAYTLNGVLNCEGQVQPQFTMDTRRKTDVRLIKNLLNQSCFKGDSLEARNSMRAWIVLLNTFLLERTTSIYSSLAVEREPVLIADKISSVMNSDLDSGLLRELRQKFAAVVPHDADRESLKRSFLEQTLKPMLGETLQGNQQIFEMLLGILSRII